MIAKELEATFNLAVHEARTRRHETVCLEHLLLAMLQDRYAIEILRACGADLDVLKQQLELHLANMDSVPEDQEFEMEQTIAVTRVLRRAAIHVQSAGKKEIDAGDVLAAMYREPESQAVFLLKEQGISRLQVLEYISHGASESPPESLPAGVDEDTADNERRPKRDPLEAFAVNLVKKAKE